jgi:hypothetical protein
VQCARGKVASRIAHLSCACSARSCRQVLVSSIAEATSQNCEWCEAAA